MTPNNHQSEESKYSYAVAFNRSTILRFIAIGATVGFISCSSSDKKSNSVTSEASTQAGWSASMQGLKEALTDLLPDIVDQKYYYEADNEVSIKSKVIKLRDVAKAVKHNPSLTERDPSIRFISQAFDEDLQRVVDSLDNGKKEYARYSLLSMSSYCIECHTRTSNGPQFHSPKLEQSISKLGSIEKGEYLLSIREFDKALTELEKGINEQLNSTIDYFALNKAIRYALGVTIKFQKSPEKALHFVNIIESSPKTPYALKQNAKGWRLAIKDWTSEKKTSTTSAKDSIKKANSLVEKGVRMQSGLVDQGGDIYFLRSLSELHAILNRKDLKKEELGEALYLTGVSYESIREVSFWNLYENYYESCIKTVPHTVWSKKSYKRLEDSVYLGYSGSGGVSIPIEVQKRLQELQEIAL